GAEVDDAIDVGELGRVAVVAAVAAGVDVHDEPGAGGGAGALPEFVAVAAVVGKKEDGAVDVHESHRGGARRRGGVDVGGEGDGRESAVLEGLGPGPDSPGRPRRALPPGRAEELLNGAMPPVAHHET